MELNHRKRARALCAQYEKQGQPLAWFEELYREAAGDPSVLPWADLKPNPHLCDWQRHTRFEFRGQSCLVVGCGLGDDAEYLASLGGDVVAFDISPTAIAWCRQRFPNSTVQYQVANLFEPPAAWERGFEFVLESYTLPALAPHLVPEAMRRIASFVAVSGTLLTITRGRDATDPAGVLPRSFAREELVFTNAGLTEVSFEDYFDQENPPVRRFRVQYTRP